MRSTVTQPSWAPSRKILSVMISGAITTFLISLAGNLGIELSQEVAAAITGAIMANAGYWIKEWEAK